MYNICEMCIKDVLHMYYRCMNCMCNNRKQHTCITYYHTCATFPSISRIVPQTVVFSSFGPFMPICFIYFKIVHFYKPLILSLLDT